LYQRGIERPLGGREPAVSGPGKWTMPGRGNSCGTCKAVQITDNWTRNLLSEKAPCPDRHLMCRVLEGKLFGPPMSLGFRGGAGKGQV